VERSVTETAQTIKDSLEVITPYLQSLADKLDTTASYLWAIQIKQAYIQGITALAIPLILALIAFVVFKVGSLIANKLLENETKEVEEYNNEHPNSIYRKAPPKASEYYPAVIIPVGALSILSIVSFFAGFSTVLTCLFNPEYYALQQLINMFK
jgi:hypothetical protein